MSRLHSFGDGWFERRARFAAVALVASVLSGCSFFDFSGDDDHDAVDVDVDGPSVAEVIADAPEVADLEAPPTAPADAAAPDPLKAQVGHPEMMRDVIARYEAVLPELKDEDVRARVQKRVTDLKLEQGTLAMDQDQIKAVIKDYEALLASPASPAVHAAMQTSIRYQLARAKEMSGDNAAAQQDLDALVTAAGSDTAAEPLVEEAMFRRAESAFSRGDYRLAAEAYTAAGKSGSVYYQHANYMLGWSRLKLLQSNEALHAFFLVVAELGNKDKELKISERELLADTLRASVMALQREHGVATLADLMTTEGKPSWQAVLYIALGRAYLAQERYQDAAATFGRFEIENPLVADAPSFALMAIDALDEGDFPAEVERLKPSFVDRYGRGTPFHQALGDEAIAPYRGRLREFIDQLSTQAHADAQAHPSREAYLAASHWYEVWLTNFDVDGEPGDKIGDIMFLRAEALHDGEALADSVAQYRALVKRFPSHPRAREASYAAVLGLTTLAESDAKYNDVLLATELDFADRFSDDPRAGSVQMHAARSLLDKKDFAAAAGAAEDALKRFTLNEDLALKAHQIAGEAQSTLGALDVAEGHFAAARSAASDPTVRADMEQRLLATVNQRADLARQHGQNDEAIAHLRRLADLAPNRETAIAALMNVAAIQTESKDLAGAAKQLEEIRRRYPDHAVTQDIPLRLADIYEQLNQPAAAANELLNVQRTTKDAEQAREALYHAAELMVSAKSNADAEALFKQYVERFPTPEPVNAEAIGKLAAFAAARGDAVQQSQWWQRQLERHEKSGEPRVRYLSAEAAFGLADRERLSFETIALTQPLAPALKQKRAALEQALQAYERAATFGVSRFVTAATGASAGMYERLNADILKSERPPNLSAEGTQKYEALLAEQGRGFVAKSIELYELNAQRARDGTWDDAVAASFQALARVAPERYRREERSIDLLALP